MNPYFRHQIGAIWLWVVFVLLVNCHSAFAFSSGDRVQCTGTDVHVRTSTDTSNNGNIIGSVNTGDLGTFQSGPVVTGGHNWYYVKWDRYTSPGYTADYVQAAAGNSPAPTASGVNPSSVTGSSSSRTFTISGSNFASGAVVQVGYKDNNYTFTNTNTAATFINSSQLTVPINTNTTVDTWNVRVKNPDGQASNTVTFNVTAAPVSAPVLNSISPSTVTGSSSPQTFTIYGSNFVSGAKLQVAYAANGYAFVDTSSQASFVNSTQLTVPVTTSTQQDTWKIRVQNPDSQNSNQVNLTVNAPPVSQPAPGLTGIYPTSVVGSTSPQTFTLNGSNFVTGATVQVAYAANNYTFVNTNTAATLSGTTQLTVPITTSTQADTWQIRVRNSDAQTSPAVNLTVTSPPVGNAAPVLGSISPNPVVGSTSAQTFTLNGSDFVSGSKVQVAYAGNSYAFVNTTTAATFVSATQLTVPITTSKQADTWHVRIINPDAKTSNSVDLVVSAPSGGNPAPALEAISPSAVVGSTTSRTFTLTGSDFVSGVKVQVAYAGNGYTFVATNTNPTFVSASQLTVPITTSTEADTWKIRVINPDNQTSNQVNLTVTAPPTGNPAPVLGSISPGSVVGSSSPQTFTLTGSNFVSGAVVQVAYSGNSYTFVNTNTAASFVSSTKLTVPLTTSTQQDTWNVRVKNPDGQTSNVATFSVTNTSVSGPTISGISPSSLTGSASPRTFVLTGSGFLSGAVVQVAFHDNGYQFQNTSIAAILTGTSQLSVPINTGATVDTWQVRVRNLDGGISNVVDFQILATSGNLAISGASSVIPGDSANYQIFFGQQDVTSKATLFFAQAPPSFASLAGSTLFISKSATTGTISLQAQYQSSGTTITSNAFPVTIKSGFAAAFVATPLLDSGTTYNVNLVGSVSGGTAPYTYRWDTNNDGTYGDLTGQSRSYSITSTGGTYPLALEVTDATGIKAYAKNKLVINKPAVVNQPILVKPVGDIGIGMAYGADGHLFKFDTNRTANGFILITHGLYGSGFDPWLKDMAQRIDTRLADANAGKVPNIAIYDWSEDSDPGGEVSPYAIALLQIVSTLDDGVELLDASRLGLDAVEDEFFKQQLEGLLPDPLEYLEEKTAYGSDFLIDAYYVRKIAQADGQSLASWIWLQARAGLIDPDQPIHLIAHSAGGFLIGECALWLQGHPLPNGKVVTVDRVTMLDTPFPIYSHLTLLPYPGTVERIISSGYGALEFPETARIQPDGYYRLEPLRGFQRRWDTGTAGHGLSYRWYARTIEPKGETDGAVLDSYGTDGFSLSPFLDSTSVATRGSSLLDSQITALKQAMVSSVAISDQALGNFSTFGQVAATNNVYTLHEQSDAGLVKSMQVPVGAQSLKFKFWFSSPGDGDFLAIRFGDDHLIYIGLDDDISRNGFTSVQAPLTGLGGKTAQFVITLVSRGQANAVLQISDLAISIDSDPDGDNLTNEQEAMYGTDPLKPDTDFDGVNDGVEIVAGTNPLDATSFPSQIVTTPTVRSLTVLSSPANGGSALGGGTCLAGTNMTVTAKPAAGYAFTGWTEYGTRVETKPVYSFTVSENRSLVANFAPIASAFDEHLDFNDNQTPAGWTIETVEGTANSNGSVANQRFEVRQVDNYVGMQRDKPVPDAATQIKIEYDGNVTSNYWGQATQVQLVMADNSLYVASIGKSGYGDSSISVAAGKNGSNPLELSKTYPLDTGTYHVIAVIAEGKISYTATKQGSSTPLFNEVVSLPDLRIHSLKTLRMFAFTTTGDPSWIDNVDLAALYPAGSGYAAVTVQGNPSNAGTVSGDGNLPVGASQSVSATALTGWTFSGWNDGNTANPRAFIVGTNGAAFTANFVQHLAALSIKAVPSNGGTVKGSGSFQVGTTHQISATTSTGWTFSGWSDGSIANPRNVVIPEGGITYTANFTANAMPAPVITDSLNPPIRQGVSFAYQITATNNPTSYAATGLPSGLSVSTVTGKITGHPTNAGTHNVTIKAANSGGTGIATLSLVVKQAYPVITSGLNPPGRQGVSFAYQITATSSPTSYGASGLPSGLIVSTSTGKITGHPTKAGTYSVIVKATNSGGTGTATLNLVVKQAIQ